MISPVALPAARSQVARQWRVAAVAAGIAGLFALTLASDTARILLTIAADPLLHTTSAAGGYLLLACALIAAIRLGAAGSSGDADSVRLLGRALLVAIASGHALALLAHLAYTQAAGISVSAAAYHWRGAENTYMALAHTHIGKAALAHVWPGLSWLPGRYDQGESIAAWVPGWMVLGMAVCAATALAAGWRLLPAVAGERANRWLFGAVFVLALVNCIKTMFDGGPLTYRFLPGFATLAVLTLCANGITVGDAVRRTLPMLAGAAAALLLVWASSADEPPLRAGFWLVLMAAMFALALGTGSGRAGRRMASLAGLALLGGAVWATILTEGTGVLLQPLPSGYRYSVVDLERGTVVETGSVIPGTRPAQLYRMHGDDPLKPRRVFIWEGIAGARLPLTAGVILLDGHARTVSDLAAPALETVWASAGPHPTHAFVSFRPRSESLPPAHADTPGRLSRNNYYVHLHLAAGGLRRLGLTEFILVPMFNEAAVRRFAAVGG